MRWTSTIRQVEREGEEIRRKREALPTRTPLARNMLRLSHSIYECKYHIVFCPKYRCRFFKDDVAEYTRQQIYSLCKQKEQIKVLQLNIQTDHVHLLVSVDHEFREIHSTNLTP